MIHRRSRRRPPSTTRRPRIHLRMEALEDRVLLTTYLVSNTNDSGPGSLRQAILDSDAVGGGNTILFNIGTGGVQTIRPASALPQVTAPVFIDGTSEPGFAGSPLIVLDGSSAGSNSPGLWITSGGCTVRGLVINHFTNSGILLQTGGGNLITGDYLGTDLTATLAQGNNTGLSITASNNNTVGGTTVAARNVIAGNTSGGISVFGIGTAGNVIEGNFIGTNGFGTAALPNAFGIGISTGAANNTVGGTAAGARNVIAGNGSASLGGDGVAIFSGANGNVVEGNYIGTDATGSQAMPNAGSGVSITSSSSNNTVGGTAPGAGNVLSANHSYGVDLLLSASGNVVQGNRIGTDVSGTIALGNGVAGVGISDAASGSTVGGTTAAAANEISGNVGSGVVVFGTSTSGNLIEGNLIGTDPSGAHALGNAGSGVAVSAAASTNTIGGASAAARNLIAGNGSFGVVVFNTGTSGNVVQGNFIGTDASGTVALPNHASGVSLSQGASGNTVGGAGAAGNVISGNRDYGVSIGSGANHNLVLGNAIGTDVSQTRPLGNGYGVGVFMGSFDNTIGGLGAANVISANTNFGVALFNSGTDGNVVADNRIGTDVTGSQPLGNGTVGISISDQASDNTIGGLGLGTGNVIAANGTDGIEIFNPGTDGNVVGDNAIGTDRTASQPLGNGGSGITISDSASDNTIGGTGTGARNIISANTNNGVFIFNSGATGNQVQGNLIGTDLSGTNPLGNGGSGVLIFFDANGNLVGGTAAGEGNTIGFNGVDGVQIDTATNDGIHENSIFSSGNLGIELLRGGENGQAFPTLTSATSDGVHTAITGTLSSAADTSFTLEFFANDVCNPSGFGEGQQFIGSMSVISDDNGNASFTATFAVGIDVGRFITATATDPGDNTSAFSACLVVTPANSRQPPQHGSLPPAVPVSGGSAAPAAAPSGSSPVTTATVSLDPAGVDQLFTAHPESGPVPRPRVGAAPPSDLWLEPFPDANGGLPG